jgi:hypothetical protein
MVLVKYLCISATSVSEPEITEELSGDGRTAKFDAEGNVVFGNEWRNPALTAVRRLSMETSNISSQGSSAMSGFDNLQATTGLTIRVNFKDESPLIRTKIETIINYVMHMHLTTKLSEKEMVNLLFQLSFIYNDIYY